MLTVKYIRSGWNAVKNSLSTIAKYGSTAGKIIKGTMKMAFDPSSWRKLVAKLAFVKTFATKSFGKAALKGTLIISVGLAIGMAAGKILKDVLFEGKDVWQWAVDRRERTGERSALYMLGESIGMIRNAPIPTNKDTTVNIDTINVNGSTEGFLEDRIGQGMSSAFNSKVRI